MLKRIGSFAIVFLLVSIVSRSTYAQDACFGIFRVQEASALDALIRLEDEVNELWKPLMEPPTGAMTVEYLVMLELKDKLQALHDEYEKAADHIVMLPWPELKKEIDVIHDRVLEIKAERDRLVTRELNRDFSVLMQDPQTMRPDTYYEVKGGVDPYVEKVYFSADVVKEVFWANETTTYASTIEHVLNAIYYHGKVGHKEIGITQFTSATDVYKVRVLGVGGNLRVAGFFVGRTYYVVAWSYSSDHGNSDPLVNAVRRIREKMGL